ncbi:MAG: hypothetical protein HYU43_07200 [Armatimonadetes bacterium]|nr:hypothetical protein [Armatimonadota bacterium]
MNAPGRPDILVNLPDAAVSITRIMDRSLNDMLTNGEIDALIGARKPASLGRDPRVRRLFPNYRGLEQEYYRQTGIFPIMHTVVIQEEIYREQPWIAESLYKAFAQAKEVCAAGMRFSSALRYMLPWLHADLEEMEEVFGGDPWPYGLEANRHVLTTLVQYLVEQRLLPRPVPLASCF